MRNRRLTISALAVVLLTGCGADSGLDPELLELVGSWEVASWTFTQVAAPNAVEDAFGTAGGVRDAQFYFYDHGEILTTIFFTDPLVDPAYGTIAFEVIAAGDTIDFDTSMGGLGGNEVDVITDVNAFCGTDGEVIVDPDPLIDGDVIAPCTLLLVGRSTSGQVAWGFDLSGDDLTIDGPALYIFAGAVEDATFELVMDRFILDDPGNEDLPGR